MLTLIQRCDPVAEPYGELVLPFDLRIRSRLRTRLASGEEAVLVKPSAARSCAAANA